MNIKVAAFTVSEKSSNICAVGMPVSNHVTFFLLHVNMFIVKPVSFSQCCVNKVGFDSSIVFCVFLCVINNCIVTLPPEVIKLFFMLISTELENSTPHEK